MVREKYSHLTDTVIVLGYNIGINIQKIKKEYPKHKIVIYQLEQLWNNMSQWYDPQSSNPAIIKRTNHITVCLNECDEIWDYDLDNIGFIVDEGFTTPIVFRQLEYCDSLNYHLVKNKNPKYDVLFYGSVNDRRYEYLKRVDEKYNLLVIAPDAAEKYEFKNVIKPIFGREIYDYVIDTKVVLNIHYYDSRLQEQARLFELLCNNTRILSEKSRRNYFDKKIEEFNTDNFDEMLSKIDNIVQEKVEKVDDKPKIGIIYNSFYGVNQLIKSVDNMRKIADYIVVIHQRVGFFGNKESKDNYELLVNLKVDEVVFYKNKKDMEMSDGVLEKRNIGLEHCKKAGCDYVIPMDNDEEYDCDLLLQEILDMRKNNIETMYSPIITYYYDENHYYHDTYYVPSCFKVNDRVFKKSKTSILCDPLRKMEEMTFKISKFPMHHYSLMVSSLKEKYNKNIASRNPQIKTNYIKIAERLKKWKEGDKGFAHLNDLTKGGASYLGEMELIKKT